MTAFAEVFGGFALLMIGGWVGELKRTRRLAPSEAEWRQSRDEAQAYVKANPVPDKVGETAEDDIIEIELLEELLEELQARERFLNFKLSIAGRQAEPRDHYRPPPDEDGPGAGSGPAWEDGPAAGTGGHWEDDEDGPNAGR